MLLHFFLDDGICELLLTLPSYNTLYFLVDVITEGLQGQVLNKISFSMAHDSPISSGNLSTFTYYQ